jgi:hypothetical protein
MSDPLDGLVERITADPGAAFAPEMLERLAALKHNNRAAFEALRLDEALAEQSGGEGRRRQT